MLNKVLEVLTPIGVGIAQGLVWFVKEFWLGIKGIFDNIVVLAVIIPLVFGTWAYTVRQNNDEVREKQHTINQLVAQVKCLRAKKCK